MMLKSTAQAGSLESSDCMVVVSPAEVLEIEYKGQNSEIFKTRTLKIAEDIANRYGENNVAIHIHDQGALEITLRARIETAFERAGGQKS